MPDLYIKLDGQKVIEACESILDGGQKVTATKEQCDQILIERYDAESDGVSITKTAEGNDSAEKTRLDATLVTKEADRQARREAKAAEAK